MGFLTEKIKRERSKSYRPCPTCGQPAHRLLRRAESQERPSKKKTEVTVRPQVRRVRLRHWPRPYLRLITDTTE